ncbi:hypothetical protein DL98DRAFT_68970 [Cadophora sp. DSE1049]|nr:hypothetical protein DL98DRAFT_68970 [Cadophora sp. DSE1049]
MADDGHSHLNSQHDNRRAPFPFNPSSNGLERAQSISTSEEGAIAPGSSKSGGGGLVDLNCWVAAGGSCWEVGMQRADPLQLNDAMMRCN